jgi:hypothetical protein
MVCSALPLQSHPERSFMHGMSDSEMYGTSCAQRHELFDEAHPFYRKTHRYTAAICPRGPAGRAAHSLAAP